MLITAIIIGLIIGASTAWLVWSLYTAPFGIQDENGFRVCSAEEAGADAVALWKGRVA